MAVATLVAKVNLFTAQQLQLLGVEACKTDRIAATVMLISAETSCVPGGVGAA
ncbi:MAG: hypothetical protein V3V30_05705 [Parvularculaceae bacterium]